MTFNEYYRYYLSLHRNKNCRRLHLLGMAVAIGVASYFLVSPYWWFSLAGPMAVYPFAWMGHFLFEKNTPATWENPLWAGLADLRMTWDIFRGRLVL